jgi:hypothetical protein
MGILYDIVSDKINVKFRDTMLENESSKDRTADDIKREELFENVVSEMQQFTNSNE